MSSFRSPLHSHILSQRNFSRYFQTLPQKDQPDDERVIPQCRFCEEDLDGSTSIYCCEKCGFYIHTSCATPPRQIQHPRHQHPLNLRGPDHKFFYYQCVESDCRLGFKVKAGKATRALWVERYYRSMLQEAGDGEPRLQRAHEHPLTSFPTRSRIFCRACITQISEEAYGCGKCNFVLHEACAKAPGKIQSHPFHPQHPLYLFYHSSNFGICRACGDWYILGYRCEECQISFDLSCLISTMPCEDDDEIEDIRRRLSGTDHSVHRHQLSSYHLKTETRIRCYFCCKAIPPGDFLGCLDCKFFIHESCVQPPVEITHHLHPEHTLNFAHCPDEKEHKCSYCKDYCYTEGESCCYICEKCDYFIHVRCASEALLDLEKGEGMTVQCSFHEHELKLDNLHRYYNCTACEGIIPMGALVYKCFSQGCSFNLHKSCAQLPSNLEHPSHPRHPLTLGIKLPSEDIVLCGRCDEGISGLFAFSCGECNFYLHVACAQKPTLKHPFHEHNLFHFACLKGESRPNNFKCMACLKRCNYDCFRCAQCDFTLHYDCSQSPSTIKSKHHWEPLVLHDSYKEDNSGEYYCNICEKRRDPNKWVYCSEVDDNPYIAHVQCALSPVKLEVIEEDEIIRQKEDIERQEAEIKLVQEQVEAKEVSLRPQMVELESMRAKLDSQRADLEELKTDLAKWINEEATEDDEHTTEEEHDDSTDGEQQNNATDTFDCRIYFLSLNLQ